MLAGADEADPTRGVEALLSQIKVLGHAGIADFAAYDLLAERQPRRQGVYRAAPQAAAVLGVVHVAGDVAAAQVESVLAFQASGQRSAPVRQADARAALGRWRRLPGALHQRLYFRRRKRPRVDAHVVNQAGELIGIVQRAVLGDAEEQPGVDVVYGRE